MRLVAGRLLAAVAALCVSATVPSAQSPQSPTATSVPRVIRVTGTLPLATGPAAPVEIVTFAIYADETGGEPLWQETQHVTVDRDGQYAVLLGSTLPDGVPLDVFIAQDARWFGVHVERPGEPEARRVLLASVPYALRASDADTLGGRPASAFLLAPDATTGNGGAATTGKRTASTTAGQGSTNGNEPGATAQDVVLAGTVNVLAKYVTAADVGPSAVSEVSGRVGINTGAALPADYLHIKFTDPFGAFTGLAVQNLSNNANAASGMLFYDHNGVLTQFQGFNNANHAYVINNIAKNGANQFDGTYNFLLGGSSRIYVSPFNVGIGTASPTPFATLDVSNAVSGAGTTNLNVTTYSANGFGPNLIGKKARGTQGAPTSVLNNDALLDLSANGYGATGFASLNSANISMRASENWTDTAQGSIINFSTTPSGTTGPITRMTVGSNGNVGIGVFSTQANLEVSNANGVTGAGMIFSTTFTNAGTSLFVGRRARGTGIAPTAVLNGDGLAGFVGRGRGATSFGGVFGAGMYVRAAENWTDTAQGAALSFNTTPIGTTGDVTRMAIDQSGNVGIGTLAPSAPLEVSRTGQSVVISTAYTNAASCCSAFIAQSARGTAAAPTAVQVGDLLGTFGMSGYGTTSFNDIFAGVFGAAAENFTDTARGTVLGFGTTPLGTKDVNIGMALLPSGDVGIGTPADANGIPTATDKLQVFGDVRVGTTGTNGCVKNFAGTQLTGTCVSDRRFKKNITPFGSTLNQLTALQPVHFYWRAAEFPDRHFGEAQTYGLIAQDVEQVFPELVVTGEDGFKAIDYSKLPLLTIQAVKELKTENDALKARLTEIERLIQEMRPASQR